VGAVLSPPPIKDYFFIVHKAHKYSPLSSSKRTVAERSKIFQDLINKDHQTFLSLRKATIYPISQFK
jgi:hypothetical protein